MSGIGGNKSRSKVHETRTPNNSLKVRVCHDNAVGGGGAEAETHQETASGLSLRTEVTNNGEESESE
jgi:hypothetical protein